MTVRMYSKVSPSSSDKRDPSCFVDELTLRLRNAPHSFCIFLLFILDIGSCYTSAPYSLLHQWAGRQTVALWSGPGARSLARSLVQLPFAFTPTYARNPLNSWDLVEIFFSPGGDAYFRLKYLCRHQQQQKYHHHHLHRRTLFNGIGNYFHGLFTEPLDSSRKNTGQMGNTPSSTSIEKFEED